MTPLIVGISIFSFLVSSVFFPLIQCQTINPVVEIRAEKLREIIDNNLLVFVIENDLTCKTNTSNFETGARIAEQNGLIKYLNITFVKLTMDGERGAYCTWPNMKLYRYGKLIRYGANPKTGVVLLNQESLTTKGIFEWLDKNTIPAAEIIQTAEELQGFVKSFNSSIVGYLKDGSKSRLDFWSVADKLKEYSWGIVVNSSINPYGDVDTILINQDFGTERLMLNDKLTEESIANFVKSNAHPTPPPPTPPPTAPPVPIPGPNVVYIYDAQRYFGNEHRVNLSSGCVNLSDTWEQEVQSIRTFKECVIVYEHFSCRSKQPDDNLELNNSNMEVKEELGRANFHRRIRSIETCTNQYKRMKKTSGAGRLGLFSNNNVAFSLAAVSIMATRQL